MLTTLVLTLAVVFAAALPGTAGTVTDWYNSQTLGLTNSTVFWRQIAPKPVTNKFSSDRSSKNDAMHIVVVDDNGSVTGIQGNILEKHISLSKASDSVSAVNSPQRVYYKNYLGLASEYIFAGRNPSAAADTFTAQNHWQLDSLQDSLQ